METDLIGKALAAAPWMAPLLAMALLWRKEIGAVLTASRGDTALETLLGQMVKQFADNLEFFKSLNDQVERIERNGEALLKETERTNVLIGDLNKTQQSILTEIVRDARRG